MHEAAYRFTSNMEILFAVLRELFKEQSQKGINILCSGSGALGGSVRVRVSDIDRLIQENNTGVGVPGELVVVWLDVAIDGCGTKFHEQTGHGRAPRATIEPQCNWVVCWIISRLEKP